MSKPSKASNIVLDAPTRKVEPEHRLHWTGLQCLHFLEPTKASLTRIDVREWRETSSVIVERHTGANGQLLWQDAVTERDFADAIGADQLRAD